jgi:hypothetical protein
MPYNGDIMMDILDNAETHPFPADPDFVRVNFPTLGVIMSKKFIWELNKAGEGELKAPLPFLAKEVYDACYGDNAELANTLIIVFTSVKMRLYPPPEQLQLFEKDPVIEAAEARREEIFGPRESEIERMYEESIQEIIQNPEKSIQILKDRVEVLRENHPAFRRISIGGIPQIDWKYLLIWLGGWGLLLYNWNDFAEGPMGWIRWAIGAFLILFSSKIIHK